MKTLYSIPIPTLAKTNAARDLEAKVAEPSDFDEAAAVDDRFDVDVDVDVDVAATFEHKNDYVSLVAGAAANDHIQLVLFAARYGAIPEPQWDIVQEESRVLAAIDRDLSGA